EVVAAFFDTFGRGEGEVRAGGVALAAEFNLFGFGFDDPAFRSVHVDGGGSGLRAVAGRCNADGELFVFVAHGVHDEVFGADAQGHVGQHADDFSGVNGHFERHAVHFVADDTVDVTVGAERVDVAAVRVVVVGVFRSGDGEGGADGVAVRGGH